MKFSVEERMQKIINLLKKKGKVNVSELVELLGVSEVTIRNDLKELESRGFLKRTHGGAIVPPELFNSVNVPVDSAYMERLKRNAGEKKRLGEATAKLLENGDTILMDDGTTTLYIAKSLSNKSLTIVTAGINIYMELLDAPGIEVISTGGYLKKDSLSLGGPIAEEVISKFKAEKAILAASSISLTHGLTTPDLLKAELKKKMVEAAMKLIVVADHTKIEKVSLIEVIPVDQIDVLVTGRETPQHIIKKYQERGIEVICA